MYKPNFYTVAVRSAAALTDSYVAGTVITGPTGIGCTEFTQLTIYFTFTKASATSAEIQVSFSNDNTNFYQESQVTAAAGVSTTRENIYQIVAANQAEATQTYRIRIPINDRYIKISSKLTGTAASTSAAAEAVLSTN